MAELTSEQVPQQVKDLFNKGFAAFERGNLDYAIDLLFSCIETEPRFLQARKFLRAAEIQRSKQKRASSLSRTVSTLKGLPVLAMIKSGKMGDDALIATEKLLRDDPLNIKFVKAFAQAATNANLPEAAVQTLEIARDYYPEDISIINWLGLLYQKMGRTKSAKECFEKLCELTPNNPDALKALKDAMALDSMKSDGWQEIAEKGGTYRDIIKDEEEAVLLEQQSKAVKSEKDAMALIAEGLEKIAAEPDNINYYRNTAKLYAQESMFAEAMDILQKAIDRSPGDPELENTASNIRIQKYDHEIAKLREGGDVSGAESRELEKAQYMFDNLQERIAKYPNDLKLRYDYGVMLFDNDYLNEAIQQFQLSQRSPKHLVKSLYYLAMCFRQKGQYDIATEQLEKAAEELFSMDDTKKDIYYQLGEVSELMGNLPKAAEYYKKIYQVDIGYRDIAQKIEHVYKKK